MKILDLDKLVIEEARVKINNKEYKLYENTLYQWGEYSRRVEALSDEPANQEMLDFQKWAIKSLIPDLDVREATPSEFSKLCDIVLLVYGGGIAALGKKTRPLNEILSQV